MASSLLIGVSGLQANQQLLDVVGNNLANSNTTGFKAQRVDFQDILYQTLSPASGPTSGSGGTNPVQSGFGVKVSAIDTQLTQGSLQTTGNSLDLALQGSGFFVVNNGTRDLFTRAGSFGVDAKNFLVDPATGFRVQRFGNVGEATPGAPAFQVPGNTNIQLPFGTGIPGQATKNVTLQGNLSANANGPLAQVLTSGQPFKAGGLAATGTTTLNSLDDNTTPYVATDQLRLQGTTTAGAAVNVTVAVGPTTTLNNLLTAINTNFPGSTASLDAAGNLVVKANGTGPSSLNLTISDVAGNTGGTNWGNHLLGVTATGRNGDTVTSAIQVFDSQGTAHNLSLVFQKQGNNIWNLTASLAASEGTLTTSQVTGITFNDDGSFRQVSGTGNGSLVAQFNGITQPQTIGLNLGTAGGFNGLTEFGTNSGAAATGQDGFAAGTLASVSVGKDGTVTGVFSNGRTFALAQVAVASFANSAALNREGQNLFSISSQSGPALLGAGNTGGRGTVEEGVLEGSNVDVSLEFTRLIVAQRAYQVSSRVITVQDQVLQVLASIIQ